MKKEESKGTPVQHTWFSQAALDVTAERRRQVEVEQFTARGDDQYDQGTLASAATCYSMYAADMLHPMSQGDGFLALEGQPPMNWPWRAEWWKPKTPRDALVKAAAMLIAEIESLDRKAPEKGLHIDPKIYAITVSAVDMIPEMTESLGKHWQQPKREDILVKDGTAFMSFNTYKQLEKYDRSYPSGTYPGKMWSRTNDGISWLVWYGPGKDNMLTINRLPIEVTGD